MNVNGFRAHSIHMIYRFIYMQDGYSYKLLSHFTIWLQKAVPIAYNHDNLSPIFYIFYKIKDVTVL